MGNGNWFAGFVAAGKHALPAPTLLPSDRVDPDCLEWHLVAEGIECDDDDDSRFELPNIPNTLGPERMEASCANLTKTNGECSDVFELNSDDDDSFTKCRCLRRGKPCVLNRDGSVSLFELRSCNASQANATTTTDGTCPCVAKPTSEFDGNGHPLLADVGRCRDHRDCCAPVSSLEPLIRHPSRKLAHFCWTRSSFPLHALPPPRLVDLVSCMGLGAEEETRPFADASGIREYGTARYIECDPVSAV